MSVGADEIMRRPRHLGPRQPGTTCLTFGLPAAAIGVSSSGELVPVGAIRTSFLEQDDHGAPGVTAPGGAEAGDVRDRRAQEGDASVLEFGACRGEVVADQADVREADPA